MLKEVDLGGPRWMSDFPGEDREDSLNFKPTWSVLAPCDVQVTCPGYAQSKKTLALEVASIGDSHVAQHLQG